MQCPAMADKGDGSDMQTRMRWLPALIVGFAIGPTVSAFAETKPAPDYTKSLFTLRQTPLCNSRDDLQTLLSVLRNGQKELFDKVQGCMIFPVDGVPVVVLDREGIFDVWMRVRLMLPNGNQPIVWTAGWMLRNDDTPTISGDPSAGKIKVCLTTGQDDAHVPALTMFTNAGQLTGNLTDAWVLENYDAATQNNHAALVTTEATDLSKSTPCSEVSARMFVRDQFTVKAWPAGQGSVWDFDHVLGYTVGKLAQPGKLNLTRGHIGLRAVVVADLGNALSTSESDAAKSQPENPLNRISSDLKLAQATPLNGPDGKGNFKVCLWKDIDDVPDKKVQSVTVPSNVIFESYGQLIGDLRSPQPDIEFIVYNNHITWSVITLKSFILTKKKPCAVISVRTVLSSTWPWLFPLARESDHRHFQALKLRGHVGTQGLPGQLGDALDVGALNGTAVADIGNPLDLGEANP